MIDAHILFSGEPDFLDSLEHALEFSGASGVIALQDSENSDAKHAAIERAKESDGLICGIVTAASWDDEKEIKKQIESDTRTDLVVGYLADLRETDAKLWIQDEDIQHSLRLIAKRNISLDLLTTTDQILHLLPLLDAHPDLPIILDHCAGDMHQCDDSWMRMIREIGKRRHVYYRLSGLAAGLQGDSAYELTQIIRPHFENTLEAFGATRILYGSGWSSMETAYPAWLNTVDNLVSELSTDDKDAIYGENALSFYGVS